MTLLETVNTMLSSQADEYTVTPYRRFSNSGVVRSGLRSFVREVKRKSLRRKKLCLESQNYMTARQLQKKISFSRMKVISI